MTERRTLIDGLKATPPAIDPGKEKEFVFAQKPSEAMPAVVTINRVPVSTRIREDFAKALKRASLERQLKSVEPNTLQDILEESIEPWLRTNGYLS
jgi:hypothetical protein